MKETRELWVPAQYKVQTKRGADLTLAIRELFLRPASGQSVHIMATIHGLS